MSFRIHRRRATAHLAALLLLAGCGDDATGPDGPAVDLRGRWQVADSLAYGGTFRSSGAPASFVYAVSGTVSIDWIGGQGFVASGIVSGESGASTSGDPPSLAPVPTAPVNSLLQARGDTLFGAGLAGQIVVTGYTATSIARVVTTPADVPCAQLSAQFVPSTFTCRAVVRWTRVP